MKNTFCAHLGRMAAPFGWLLEPAEPANAKTRAFLLAQVLGSPVSALLGGFCSLVGLSVAVMRTGEVGYAVLIGLELFVIVARSLEWRSRERRRAAHPEQSVCADLSLVLSLAWCLLQGCSAFFMLQSGDPVLQVLSTGQITAITGPICARYYAAPRFAMLLVCLCMLPFAAGVILSGEVWFVALLITIPPFLFGAMHIISTINRAMLGTLAAEEENRRLAMHDSLTGILSRQGMDRALSGIVAEEGRTMALLTMDLDGFKQVNDTHGHGAGDLVLMEVARRIRGAVRETDFVARMGGDEFVIVVRNTPLQTIEKIALHVIDVVASQPIFLDDGTPVRVGASVGYACLPEDAVTTMELRLRADRALYDAKRAGKGVSRRYRGEAGAGLRTLNERLLATYRREERVPLAG